MIQQTVKLSYLTSISLMPRAWQFFLTKELYCLLINDNERVSLREFCVGQSLQRELSSNVTISITLELKERDLVLWLTQENSIENSV